MKFFEYLAAGLPVISTRLPSLEEFADYIDFADSAKEFAFRVDNILSISSAIDPCRVKRWVCKYCYRKRTKND